jgi:hypothetical protein
MVITPDAPSSNSMKSFRIGAISGDGTTLILAPGEVVTDEPNTTATLNGAFKVTVTKISTDDNASLLDLALDLDSALEEAGVGEVIEASASGESLVLTGAGTYTFRVKAVGTATELGLDTSQAANMEQAAGVTDMVIVLADGTRFPITLDGAVTVGDVVRKIQEQTARTPGLTDYAVRAEIDPQMQTRLRLRQVPALLGSPRLVFDAAAGTITRQSPAGEPDLRVQHEQRLLRRAGGRRRRPDDCRDDRHAARGGRGPHRRRADHPRRAGAVPGRSGERLPVGAEAGDPAGRCGLGRRRQ